MYVYFASLYNFNPRITSQVCGFRQCATKHLDQRPYKPCDE